MRERRLRALLAAGVTSALLFSGCASSLTSTAGVGNKADGPATSKTHISVMYGFTGTQESAFRADLDAWANKNGLTIDYQPSANFQTQIMTNINAGTAPDIAIFPQPGILKTLAKRGAIAPLSTQTNVDQVRKDIPQGFLDTATVNGVVYGAPYSMNIKSLYWYDKAVWAKNGYTVPKTQTQLMDLINRIKSTGATPVCYGLQSQGATGWPATDWIEDYVLQANGPEVYDKWISGEVKFNSPEVRKAYDIYNQILMQPGNVYGGVKNSVNTNYSTAFNTMFNARPGCYLGKQGNFITSFFPDTVQKNLDDTVGVFQTPSVSGQTPVEGGGDLVAAITKNDSNVKKVVNELTNDPSFGVQSARSGAFLSPQKGFDVKNYPNKLDAEIAHIAFSASSFRFDGSDAMPPAVGSGSFWTQMVNYTDGSTSEDAALQAIDKSWPKS